MLETKDFVGKWTKQDVSYVTRDLLLYAVGVGSQDLNFVYENSDGFEAFPTYPIVLGFKGTAQDVVSFPSPAMTEGPPLPPLEGIRGGLDGERYIEKVNDLDPAGATLILRSRLVGVFKKGSGATVQQESVLEDSKGKVFYRFASGSFLVGAKNFVDSGKNLFDKKILAPKRPPDAVEEMHVPKNQATIYRLSGDYNPLHVDPAIAPMMGFSEPILHGLCSLGFTARAFVKHYCKGTGKLFKSISARFVSPVLPGQTLRVEMWKDPDQPGRVVIISKVKETGKDVVGNAEAFYHSSDPQAKL